MSAAATSAASRPTRSKSYPGAPSTAHPCAVDPAPLTSVQVSPKGHVFVYAFHEGDADLRIPAIPCPICAVRRLLRRQPDSDPAEEVRQLAHRLGIGVLIGAKFAHLFTLDGNCAIRRRDLPAASLLRLLAAT